MPTEISAYVIFYKEISGVCYLLSDFFLSFCILDFAVVLFHTNHLWRFSMSCIVVPSLELECVFDTLGSLQRTVGTARRERCRGSRFDSRCDLPAHKHFPSCCVPVIWIKGRVLRGTFSGASCWESLVKTPQREPKD